MSLMELKGLKALQGLDTLLMESKTSGMISSHIILDIPITLLCVGKYQPRLEIDESSLQELVSSIQAQGIILPLIVRRCGQLYEIIAGERRWRAAKIAGFTTVPAIVRDVPDETALAFALIENIQREILNPIDEALAFERLKNEFSMTHEQIAERVGRSRSAVTNLMRLLALSTEVKMLLRAKKIEMGHARALLSLQLDEQTHFAKQIINNKLSVRQTEKLVQTSQQTILPPQPTFLTNEQQASLETQLANLLNSTVKIKYTQKGEGKLTWHFKSIDQINWLIKMLKKS